MHALQHFILTLTMLRVLATLPSSTAEPERIFSKVTKTLSAVRSTMTEDRLEACVLLQVHRDILPHTTDVIEHFAKNGARRLDFLLYCIFCVTFYNPFQ